MARKQQEGTGGRGGTGVLETIDVDEFGVVSDEHELSRSRTAPSPLKPLVDMARRSIGRKFEKSDPVQATDPETGEPMFGEDGAPVWETDEQGNLIRVPHTYTLAEANEFATELRAAGNRDKLPAKRLSLRIVAEPPLSGEGAAKEGDSIRIQFYVVRRGVSTDGAAS
jgi:hypothetical protein